MKFKDLQGMAEDIHFSFSKAIIEPGSRIHGNEKEWALFFVPDSNPEASFPLETARGDIRYFKTLDAAHKTFMEIAQGNIPKLEVIV